MLWLHDIARIIIITNTILAFYIVFHRRRSVSTTWAWLIILLVLPIIGLILYAFLDGVFPRKIFLQSINSITWDFAMFKKPSPKHQKKSVPPTLLIKEKLPLIFSIKMAILQSLKIITLLCTVMEKKCLGT